MNRLAVILAPLMLLVAWDILTLAIRAVAAVRSGPTSRAVADIRTALRE